MSALQGVDILLGLFDASPILKDAGTGTSAPDLFATLAKFRRELRQREAVAVSVMSEAWHGVEAAIVDKLEQLIADLLSAADAGEIIGEAWLLRQARLESLAVQVHAQIAALAQEVGPALIESQRGYVQAAVGHAETLTAAALGEAPAKAVAVWNRLPATAVEALVGFAADGSPLADLIAEIGAGGKTIAGEAATAPLSEQIRAALIQGVALGKGPRETARAMREGVAGKLAVSKGRAETIARTETLRAYREASRATYANNASIVTGWVWTATLDARTCRGCWAMHGTVHPLDSTLDDHPNGRCVAVPQTRSWADIVGDPSAPDSRPVIEGGSDQFERLTEHRQKTILGPTLFDDWKAGNVALADCVTQETDARWGSMRRAATVQEARANAARRIAG